MSGVNINELVKCISDERYFIEEYFKADNPFNGLSTLTLEPKQLTILNRIFHKRCVIDAIPERQIGTTTLLAAHALWLVLFNSDRRIVIMNETNKDAKAMRKLIKTGYDNLPGYLKLDRRTDHAHSLELANGSWIHYTNSSPDNLRGFNLSHLLLNGFDWFKPAYQTSLRAYCERINIEPVELLYV